MKRYGHSILMMLVTLIGVALIVSPASAARKNGTTLAGYKTLDICQVPDAPTTWRYSGQIAVWNEGATDTVGFVINDCLQSKPIVGGFQFSDVVCYNSTANPTVFSPTVTEIPAGTTQLTALTFDYSFDAPALPVDQYYIKNVANMTILNHSGPQYGTPFGPSPKATWEGGVPPVCESNLPKGCTYTQGYWGNKPGVVWPAPYNRTDTFFLATKNGTCILNCGGNPNDDVYTQVPKTWQEVLDTSVNESQGYYQLAHQYIAAVLNIAKTTNTPSVPAGVQTTLDLAAAWLAVNAPSACTAASSCGVQKDWAAVLDDYNNGVYPGGPPHCGDE